MVESMRGVIRPASRQVALIELPRPQLEPGTAIVRVCAAGICGSDLHLYRHRDRPEERPAGHEAAGVVVALAPHAGETPTIAAGDRVALDTICLGRACGTCRWCREGAYFHCQQKRRGPDWHGAFADYIKRDVRGLFRLPDTLSMEEGALVEPLAVAVHAVRLAAVQPGESVAIVGAGTIGLTCLIAARGLGAGNVFVLARHAHQAALARSLGAEAIVTSASAPDAATAVIRDRTGGDGADVVFETVGGGGAALDEAWPLLRRRGRLVILGLFDRQVPVPAGKALGLETTVLFSACYGTRDGRHDYEVAIDLIESGRAPVARLLTHRFPLEQAAAAFATADDKSTGAIKVQLFP